MPIILENKISYNKIKLEGFSFDVNHKNAQKHFQMESRDSWLHFLIIANRSKKS